MSRNNQDNNTNENSQTYDEEDQDQEYDSQEDNSQNNDDNGCDDNDVEDHDNDDNNDGSGGNDDNDDGDENGNGSKYIRLRGLPWSATHKEILDFLKNVTVVGGAEGIHIITRRWDGKNTGEAYVEVKSQQDAATAMKLDNASMGHRYIEVFNASPREAKEALRKTSSHDTSYVVKLRGLPYSVTEQQIEDFFNGLEIKPDREGIIFVMDRRGRATGEAFVQFESQEDTEQALGRNRQKIGHRYIEIFRSSSAELKRSTGNGNARMVPYDLKERGSNRGGGSGGGGSNDYGGNNRYNRWGNNNGGFGVGAKNTLGFNNLPNFGNNGNLGNNGNFGTGVGMGNIGNFGNNASNNFGNFGNNSGGRNFGNNTGGNNNGNGGGLNRFSSNNGNFGNDFGDFGNFGNDRGNNEMAVGNNNRGSGGGGFNNFGNFGNCGDENRSGGNSGFSNNMMCGGMNMGTSGGGGFGPIGGGRNDDNYIILMRGLPFNSFENDVFKFFDPIRPANVRIHYNNESGRHNGTAEALFDTYDDVQVAMKRNRCKMGTRYIELLFNGKSKSKGFSNYNSEDGMGNMGVKGSMAAFSRRI